VGRTRGIVILTLGRSQNTSTITLSAARRLVFIAAFKRREGSSSDWIETALVDGLRKAAWRYRVVARCAENLTNSSGEASTT
jgi:hypothetical protein